MFFATVFLATVSKDFLEGGQYYFLLEVLWSKCSSDNTTKFLCSREQLLYAMDCRKEISLENVKKKMLQLSNFGCKTDKLKLKRKMYRAM